MTEVLLD